MLVTEEEAKTKWCPHVRVMNFAPDASHNPAVNRPTADYHCIGADCMAWRWVDQKLGHSLEYMQRKHGRERGAEMHKRFCQEHPLRGFCGLAGGSDD